MVEVYILLINLQGYLAFMAQGKLKTLHLSRDHRNETGEVISVDI